MSTPQAIAPSAPRLPHSAPQGARTVQLPSGHWVTVSRDGFPIEACRRCSGYGRYSHNGYTDTCYLCQGVQRWHRLGKGDRVADAVADAARLLTARDKGADRREAKRRTDAAARQAKIEADRASAADWAAHPLAADLTYCENYRAAGTPQWQTRGFEFAYGLWLNGRHLSDKVLSISAEHSRKCIAAGARPPVVLAEGRRVLTGVIRSARTDDGDYGPQHKMVVELADGGRVFGTIPADLRPDSYSSDEWQRWMATLPGRSVTFTATVARSRDDDGFGFYSRPTKAAYAGE